MFFLFNMGSDSQDLGPIRPTACPNCHNTEDWHLYRHRTRVGAFFINFLTVRAKYALACPICGYGEEIDASRAENMLRANRSPRDRGDFR
jgi:predicted nucleic-acid-binding Zn-ribbon protein